MNIDADLIDGIARKAFDLFAAPGLSVAVLNGQDLMCRAYGVADVDTRAEMTPDTVFTVASATKSFTALAMSMLREEGAFDWDVPVCDLAGELCVGGEPEQRSITVRDILCHSSGFGWHDPLWYNSPWSRASVIRKAWLSGPAVPPRSVFQYSNVTYMLAGEIVARLSGMSYEEFVRARIFSRMGIRAAHFSHEAPPPGCAVARPHLRTCGAIEPIKRPDVSKANAACGILMSAPDMAAALARYIQPDAIGIPARVFENITAPRIAIGPREGARFYTLFGEPDFLEYGFGWFVRRYRGHRLIFHSGRLPGACSHVALLPDLGCGIVALTNHSYTCVAEAVTFSLLDAVLGKPKRDWLSYHLGVTRDLQMSAYGGPVTPSSGTAETAVSAALEGEYWDAAYGRIAIRNDHGALRLRWAHYRGDLLPVDGRRFSLVNVGCPLLTDGELVEFEDDSGSALRFLGRRFHRKTKNAVIGESPTEWYGREAARAEVA